MKHELPTDPAERKALMELMSKLLKLPRTRAKELVAARLARLPTQREMPKLQGGTPSQESGSE